LGTSQHLSIIVPIHRISGGIQNLNSWISNPILIDAEIILVHDTSDGESFLPIETICKNLTNVILLEGNFSSPGLARNKGLEIASRPWITFWDFDDLPDPINFLRMVQKTITDRNLVGLGAFQTRHRGNKGSEKKSRVYRSESPRGLKDLMINPGLWRWVFAREIVGDVKFHSIKRGEDQLFLAETRAFDYPITFCEDIVYTYFIGEENQLSNKVEFDSELLLAAYRFFNLSHTLSGETKLFSRVACLSMNLTYLKRSIRNSNFGHLWSPLYRTVLNIFKSPQALVLLMRGRIKSNKSNGTQDRVIDLYLAGGLGNQLFQIAFIFNLKSVSLLRLHQPSPDICELLNFGLLESWVLENPGVSIQLIEEDSLFKRLARNQGLRLSSRKFRSDSFRLIIYRRIRLKLVNLFLDRKTHLVIPNGIGQDKALNFSTKQLKISLIGYFQSFIYAESLLPELKRVLNAKFRDDYAISDYLSVVGRSTSLSIHLRLGDYLERKNKRFGVVSQKYILNSIRYLSMIEKFDDTILFSNDIESAMSLLSHTHIQNLTVIPSETSILESLFLMSNSPNLVISNSTFSWWAAFLPAESDKIVIAPSPWFKEYEENRDLIPLKWVRIDAGW
jgi:hypothetical protein